MKENVGQTYTILNIMDLATLLSICVLCVSKSYVDIVNTFNANWVLWAGLPEHVVVDKCSEAGAALLTFTAAY